MPTGGGGTNATAVTPYHFTVLGFVALVIVVLLLAAKKSTAWIVISVLAIIIVVLIVSNPSGFVNVFFTKK